MLTSSRFPRPLSILVGGLLALAAFHPARPAQRPAQAVSFLVVCSPGSPGDTAQAQPTMDSFAAAAAGSAGWARGSLSAVYYETAEGGLARLARPDAALALVQPAFLSRYGAELGLKPKMEAILQSGKPETWSLVAKKGKVTSAGSLDGWELTGAPGFAPDFVRAELLKSWGTLPSGCRVTFTSRVLTALQKAATGEKVAVLLDSAGAEALPSLPFAGDLEIVARSRPSPGALLCAVGNRLPAHDLDALVRGLTRLGEKKDGAEVLTSMRLSRFVPIQRNAPHDAVPPHKGRPPAAGG